MEEYPEELRTPPVALVALVGMSELHSQISKFLHTEQPPINTLALPDFSKVAVIGGKERPPLDARIPPPAGIIKAGWVHKHRTKVPSALAVLLDREQVNGDPSQWLQVCTHLDNIKNVLRGRNTKLVVVIVQPTLHGEINDDRMTALRRRAEVDSKCCLTFISHDPTELRRSLARLGSVLGELAGVFYKEESRLVKARLDKKLWSAPESAVRFNFKMGYYAEFRRDWAAALRFYETAYTLLQEVWNTPAELQSVQRVVELKAVAEQLHFKVSTLLLHGGKETEAVKWFKQHVARFKKRGGPADGVFLHLAWISQQYHVFGDLLKTTSSSSAGALIAGSGISERELQSGFYYQVAALYMTQRRESFEREFTTFESFDDPDKDDILAGPAEEIGPPLYVGQGPSVLSRTADQKIPTPDEFFRHAILTERQFSHSRAAISLLTKAHEQYKLMQAARMIYYIGTEMGREYFIAGEHENAKRLFDSVAGMYRKEAWIMPLAASLDYLRQSSMQLGLLKEYVEYSLEFAALPAAAGEVMKQRIHVQKEIIDRVQSTVTEDGAAGAAVALEIDLVSPLRGVLSVCVAFHETSVKPGESTRLTLSLLTHLPTPVTLSEVHIMFNQSACNFVLRHSSDKAAESYDLRLEPCRWKRLEVDITAGKSGKLECFSAIAHIGPSATVRCQVESPASREPVPLWEHEQAVESYPIKDINLAFSGQKTIQVEEPEPLVDVELRAAGVGLLGETFPVSIHVKSRGHVIDGGELHVSIAEVSSSSLFSPTTPASSPFAAGKVYFPAKLQDGKPETLLWELGGTVKVPYVDAGSSWSTMVFVRWTEARAISFITALGYRLQDGAGEESQQLWVQKDVELNCEDALGITCKYLAPFQRDAFLPASLEKPVAEVLPFQETSMMIVTARNICSIPLLVFPLHVEAKNDGACQVTRLQKTEGSLKLKNSCISQSNEPTKLAPGEVFNQILSVRPLTVSSSLEVGVAALKWERDGQQKQDFPAVPQVSTIDEVVNIRKVEPVSVLQNSTTTRVALPPITVEKPTLVVSLKCPAFGLLSTPLTLSLAIENMTKAVQEVKFAVVDCQGFLLSGASKGSLSLLPRATDLLSVKLLPIACGMQQLPQLTLTSSLLNASYRPPPSSSHLFVFPSPPQLQPRHLQESDDTGPFY